MSLQAAFVGKNLSFNVKLFDVNIRKLLKKSILYNCFQFFTSKTELLKVSFNSRFKLFICWHIEKKILFLIILTACY